MSDIRNKLSEKNPYYLPKHRYLELKHFCLQYPEWKRQLGKLGPVVENGLDRGRRSNEAANPTEKIGVLRAALSENVRVVEEAAREADRDIWQWLVCGVTSGIGFDCLKARMDIPCERDMYYSRYRKFFWLLDKYRT